MDLVTQTLLGAGVGELAFGRKAGNKAILWGAVGGLIPDLDVLITPFYSEVDGLFVHRGFSHSLIFAFLLAPPMGWLLHRIYRKKMNVSLREWAMLIFLAAFTHPLLDYFTTYGTGAFLPFSGYRVEFGTIGIVDVFYTLPFLLVLFIIPFLRRTSLPRRRLILGTILFTSFYLLGTVGNKVHVNRVFKEAFLSEGITFDRYRTSPLPLSNFLWMGMAESDSGYHMDLYSNFDSEKPADFTYIPRNEEKLSAFSDHEEVQKLIRFTKGYYHVNEDENGLYLADLRFGKMGIDENAGYVFKFRISEQNGEAIIEQVRETGNLGENAFSEYLSRIGGL